MAVLEESHEVLRNRTSLTSIVGKYRKRFTQVLELYPAINLYPLINFYPVIGENTLASHPSDGFLHFFLFFHQQLRNSLIIFMLKNNQK
jgi:hypothetical protein